jgi:hypothetical protein
MSGHVYTVLLIFVTTVDLLVYFSLRSRLSALETKVEDLEAQK